MINSPDRCPHIPGSVLRTAAPVVCGLCHAWIDHDGHPMTDAEAIARYPHMATQIQATPMQAPPRRETTSAKLSRWSDRTGEAAKTVNALVIGIILCLVLIPLGIALLAHAF